MNEIVQLDYFSEIESAAYTRGGSSLGGSKISYPDRQTPGFESDLYALAETCGLKAATNDYNDCESNSTTRSFGRKTVEGTSIILEGEGPAIKYFIENAAISGYGTPEQISKCAELSHPFSSFFGYLTARSAVKEAEKTFDVDKIESGGGILNDYTAEIRFKPKR